MFKQTCWIQLKVLEIDRKDGPVLIMLIQNPFLCLFLSWCLHQN
jgi:hypothetical protein